jgi:peptide/nickel transport system substrate-binding protein
VPHPFLSILEVRQGLAFAVGRDTIANDLYGPTGVPTANWLVAPERFNSPNTSYEFNIDKAKEALDAAGWVEEGGQRQKDGVKMEIIYQTSTNPIRQKTQEIVKEAFGELGVPVEIKAIDAGVFFSSDAGNPDTWAHFYADFQMYTNGPANPYPISYADELKSIDPDVHVPQRLNDWSGDNSVRWVNEEFNAAYTQAQQELDTDVQAELFIKMNDLVVNNYVHIPLVNRATVAGHAADLTGVAISRWAGDPWNIQDWGREGN